MSQDRFLLDTRNQDFVNGRSTKPATNPGAGCLLFIPLMMCLFGLPFLGLAGQQWYTWAQLKFNGVEINGVVIATGIDDSGDSTTYHVTYQFQGAGQGKIAPLQTKEESVSAKYFSNLKKGSIVPVRYVTSDPKLSGLWADGDNLTMTFFVTGFMSLWYGVLLFAILQGWQAVQKEKRFQKGALLLPAKVLSCTSQTDSDDDFFVNITYCFQNPLGETFTDKTSQMMNDLKNSPLPKPGDPLAVAYLDDKNFRLL